MPIDVHAEIFSSVSEFKDFSGDGQYLNLPYRNNYHLDIEETGILDTGHVVLNSIANILFYAIRNLAYLTVIVFYQAMNFDINDFFGDELNNIQSLMRNNVFDSVFLFAFCGSAFIIAKQFFKRDLMGSFGTIAKVVLIFLLSFLVVKHSADMLKYSSKITRDLGTNIFASVNNKDTINEKSYAATMSELLWSNLVHTPWKELEFSEDNVDDDTIKSILSNSKDSTERKEIIKKLIESNDALFSKSLGADRIGFLVIYFLLFLVKCIVFIGFSVLQFAFQVFAILIILFAPIVLLLSLLPSYSDGVISAWFKKFFETQLSVLVLTFVLALLLQFSKFFYSDEVIQKFGWFGSLFLETFIILFLALKWRELIQMSTGLKVSAGNRGLIESVNQLSYFKHNIGQMARTGVNGIKTGVNVGKAGFRTGKALGKGIVNAGHGAAEFAEKVNNYKTVEFASKFSYSGAGQESNSSYSQEYNSSGSRQYDKAEQQAYRTSGTSQSHIREVDKLNINRKNVSTTASKRPITTLSEEHPKTTEGYMTVSRPSTVPRLLTNKNISENSENVDQKRRMERVAQLSAKEIIQRPATVQRPVTVAAVASSSSTSLPSRQHGSEININHSAKSAVNMQNSNHEILTQQNDYENKVERPLAVPKDETTLMDKNNLVVDEKFQGVVVERLPKSARPSAGSATHLSEKKERDNTIKINNSVNSGMIKQNSNQNLTRQDDTVNKLERPVTVPLVTVPEEITTPIANNSVAGEKVQNTKKIGNHNTSKPKVKEMESNNKPIRNIQVNTASGQAMQQNTISDAIKRPVTASNLKIDSEAPYVNKKSLKQAVKSMDNKEIQFSTAINENAQHNTSTDAIKRPIVSKSTNVNTKTVAKKQNATQQAKKDKEDIRKKRIKDSKKRQLVHKVPLTN